MNHTERDTPKKRIQTQGDNGEGQLQRDTQLHDADSNGKGEGHYRDDTQPICATPNGNGAGVHIAHDNQPADDARPDPKPRKHALLWQAYLWWFELMEMRKRHLLRISSIERGKSNLDADFERAMLIQTQLDILVDPKNKTEREVSVKQTMINYGQQVGPIWDWCLSIKGLGEGLTAQLLAQIDDIDNSPTVSALWRFAGFSVGKDGKAEKNQKGVKSPFNRKLKGICYNIADQFIKQQTPYYVDIYYAEKRYQRKRHPKAICRECGDTCINKQKKVKGEMVDVWRCEVNGNHTLNYTDAHLHNRAWRKMIKQFLEDLWRQWNRSEGNIIPEDVRLPATKVDRYELWGIEKE